MYSKTLSGLYDDAYAKFGDRTAFLTLDGQEISFARMGELEHSVAASLLKSGVGAGDVITATAENPTVYFLIAFASQRIGATFAAVYSADMAIQQGLKIDAVICVADTQSMLTRNIMFDQSWMEGTDKVPPAETGKFIVPSSGTTGSQKYFQFDQSALVLWNSPALDIDRPSYVDILITLPVFSIFTLVTIMLAHLNGGALLLARDNAEETMKSLTKREKVDILTIPTLMFEMLETIGKGAPPPTNIGRIIMAGSAVNKSFAQKVESIFGCPFVNVYGATETGGGSLPRPAIADVENGYIGHPLDGIEMRVVDDSDKVVAPGTEGELEIRSDVSWRAESTLIGETPYNADGWFRPGDVGYQLPDGAYVVTGRTSELINSSGKKVTPATYEAHAKRTLGLPEVVAFGVPNEFGSEDVALAVTSPIADPADAIGKLRTGAVGQIVFHFFPLEKIPYNQHGKIDRKALREMFITTQSNT